MVNARPIYKKKGQPPKIFLGIFNNIAETSGFHLKYAVASRINDPQTCLKSRICINLASGLRSIPEKR